MGSIIIVLDPRDYSPNNPYICGWGGGGVTPTMSKITLDYKPHVPKRVWKRVHLKVLVGWGRVVMGSGIPCIEFCIIFLEYLDLLHNFARTIEWLSNEGQKKGIKDIHIRRHCKTS